MIENSTLTQNQIDHLHKRTMEYIKFYASGLITLPEFLREMDKINEFVTRLGFDGLIDPSTGLRFA